MRAIATREVALPGATAVLFGCRTSAGAVPRRDGDRRARLPAARRRRNRRSPVQQYSYLWCSPTPGDVDQYIALAKRAGLRMILFSYTAFTRRRGAFRVQRASFPAAWPT